MVNLRTSEVYLSQTQLGALSLIMMSFVNTGGESVRLLKRFVIFEVIIMC